MVDIARLAGVHVSTVSRALAGSSLVEKATREKIVRLARSREYSVNPAARNLRLRHTQTISVVLPLRHESQQPLTDPFLLRLIGHLAEGITQRGYALFLQKVVAPAGEWLPSLIASGRADGIISIGPGIEPRSLRKVAANYMPFVIWGARSEGPGPHCCTVSSDDTGGSRAVVEHLIRRGRRKILFMGDPKLPDFRQRHQAYVRALANGGHGLGPARVLSAQRTADAAYEAMRACLRSEVRFDAVFAACDVIAISAMHALSAAGVSVPEQVAVVGFDDIPVAAHTSPALTTVRQDVVRGAQTLVDLLFRRIAGEDTASVTLPAELIVRESS